MFDISSLRPSVRLQIKSSAVPTRFVGLEFSDLDPYEGNTVDSVQKWVRRVVNGEVINAAGSRMCGRGLLLVGKPGHGKTTLSAVTAQEVIRAAAPSLWGESIVKRPVLFTDYPKLLRLQQRAWKEDGESDQALMDAVFGEAGNDNVQLLVLDDLGKEHRTASGWAENTFDAVLRARYNAGLPTIVTTNVPLKQWADTYGEPMESFAHEAFIPMSVVSLEGDRRK